MQDNDPQNTSCAAQQFYANAVIIWWHTPPEFPDINLIKNIGLLKECIHWEVKPRSKGLPMILCASFRIPLIRENAFNTYIVRHLQNVFLSAVIDKQGTATGY